MRPRRLRTGRSIGPRVKIVVAAVVTVAVAIVFYYSFFPQRAASPVVTGPDTSEPVLRHPLTGEGVASTTDFFAAQVMYDNLFEVKQRFGLEKARVVYEALAEGGITRLMAVFDSRDEVTKIGPVRSVRPYFIDWASEYGGVLMHVGGSAEALKLLAKSTVLSNLDQIGAYEDYFTRDEHKDAPHNVFTSYSAWRRFAEHRDIAPAQFTAWHFSETLPTTTTPLQKISISYSPSVTVAWVYNPEKGKYVRFVNGAADTYVSGEQVATANIAVLVVPSKTIDAIGRQKMETIGSGSAVLLSRGLMQQGIWSKETKYSRMKLTGIDGTDMTLVPGVTWVEVVPESSFVQTTL